MTSTELDTRALFLRFTRGDGSAFDTLFRLYHPALCAFANTILMDVAAAEDCVQDVFVKLWSDRKTSSIPASPRAYLYAAVRNRALNQLDRASVRSRWEASESGSADSANDSMTADTDLLARESVERIQAALAKLPPRARVAMTLRWYEEMSYSEIALAMGISEKSVENQLARALKALRGLIQA